MYANNEKIYINNEIIKIVNIFINSKKKHVGIQILANLHVGRY